MRSYNRFSPPPISRSGLSITSAKESRGSGRMIIIKRGKKYLTMKGRKERKKKKSIIDTQRNRRCADDITLIR